MLLARLHHILRGLSPVEVVDCDVGAFLGERYAYDFAEAAVKRAYAEPPVTNTFLPLRSYGMVNLSICSCGSSRIT
jgi:hypothetical protein